MSLLNAVDGEIENILARSSSLLLPVPSSVPTNNGDVKSLEDRLVSFETIDNFYIAFASECNE